MSAVKDGGVSVEELQRLQGLRLKALLKEHGKSQKWLAERFHFSETSVSHWANGKVHMSDYNAMLICSEFPECSPEYLRGYADYPNETEAMRDRRKQHDAEFFTELDCVETLLKLNGGTVEYFSKLSGDESEIAINADGETFTTSVRFNEFAKLARGGQTLVLTMAQWRAFRTEIGQYMNMRLDSMFERGCW